MASEIPTGSYVNGYHSSVLNSHLFRSLKNSGPHLMPYLEKYKSNPTIPISILDAGCGPGSLTCDIAEHLLHAKVTGIDRAALESWDSIAATRGLTNVTFQQADIFHLPFADNTFDIVHVHTVLAHLTAPVVAITELIRVCKHGGIVTAREGDVGGFLWFPESLALDNWKRVYHATVKACRGGDPDAGRKLHRWFMDAGIPRDNLVCSSSNWLFTTPAERAMTAGWWAERTLKSEFAQHAIKHGTVNEEEGLKELAKAWEDWAEQDDGWSMVPSGEVVAEIFKKAL